MAHSDDGVNWSTPTKLDKGYKSAEWNAITYGNGRFVLLGTEGFISYSDDGVTFNSPILVGDDIWECCTYGGDKFVAMGRSKQTAYSSDGINWSKPKAVGEVGSWWKEIAYTNEKFVGIGNRGWIICSSDGINWGKAERITDESGKEITTNFYGVCAVH